MTPRVIVAHETAEIREAALRVVRDAGYEGIGVAEGQSARALLASPPQPAALVVDVGLPGVLGYELVEEIRERGLPTKVILIASVYSHTAYKRRPTSLYGADDYVEQHHITDRLAAKLATLVPAPRPVAERDVHDPAGLTADERTELLRIRDASEGRLAFTYATRAEGVERARRLARLIASDILLYNGDRVAAAHDGELDVLLGHDLEAGRQLFALRVPPEIAATEDFVGAALRELAARRGP